MSLSFPQDFWGNSGPKTAKLGTLPASAGSLERAWHSVLGVGFASEMEEELCRWPFVSGQNTPIVYRLSLKDIQWLSKFHCVGEESWEGLSWFSGSPCPWAPPCPPLLRYPALEPQKAAFSAQLQRCLLLESGEGDSPHQHRNEVD